MPEEGDPKLAVELFRKAYERQAEGEYSEAIELYTSSIEAFPTAEAYTFRGWAYSLSGDVDRAIADCMQAIEIDPDFGNPYNDIGAYLIEQGKPDEAVEWFEKALTAQRYESRCFPHFNLGRVYERRRQWRRAMACYARAIIENPEYETAKKAFRRLQAMWN
jgi:tetratricopeptide (TPR) repeat protein